MILSSIIDILTPRFVWRRVGIRQREDTTDILVQSATRITPILLGDSSSERANDDADKACTLFRVAVVAAAS